MAVTNSNCPLNRGVRLAEVQSVKRKSTVYGFIEEQNSS